MSALSAARSAGARAVLAEVLLRARDLMLRLRAEPRGVFTKPPRTIHLTQTVPFGEHSAATVVKLDERVEREENVLVTALPAALAEELPLQLSATRITDIEE